MIKIFGINNFVIFVIKKSNLTPISHMELDGLKKKELVIFDVKSITFT